MTAGERDRGTGPDAEAEARARVDALFERFNALTPADLGHIGLQRADPEARRTLVEQVEARRVPPAAPCSSARPAARHATSSCAATTRRRSTQPGWA